MMYVVGATHPSEIQQIREIIPDYFLLIPGVGAQGGNLEEIAEIAINKEVGMLINSSRSIIYAGSEADFALQSRNKALEYQQQMKAILTKHNLI